MTLLPSGGWKMPGVSERQRREHMPARSPEEICRLFQQAMAEGDLDLVMSVYDPEAAFLN
jgi:hypothetical protein